MFTMMNQARLAMGAQGVGLAEHAFQDALSFARERRQGAVDGTPSHEMTAIIDHPDVRRMLMGMKAKIAAARAVTAVNALAIDLAKHASDATVRAEADALAALLTPISKAYGSDIAVEVASEAVQVHGGMGFIEETGVGQHYRDARIIPIYEGTNGIQNVDLVARKLPMQGGAVVRRFIAELKETILEVRASNEPALGAMASCLGDAVADLEETTEWMLVRLSDNRDAALAGATPYGRLFANAACGVLLARGALAAMREGEDSKWAAQIATARHFAETQATQTSGLKRVVYNAHETLSKEYSDVTLNAG
jgi:butyryl-CoA dehydrogenase